MPLAQLAGTLAGGSRTPGHLAEAAVAESTSIASSRQVVGVGVQGSSPMGESVGFAAPGAAAVAAVAVVEEA